MKLCRFELKSSPGQLRSGIVYSGKIYETDGKDPVAVHEADQVRPLTPVAAPCVRVYRSSGLRDVDRWSPTDLEAAPFFYANASAILGPSQLIQFPEFSAEVDFEPYVAAVVAERGRNIPANEADGYLLGFTIAIALVARDVERRDQAVGMQFGRAYDLGLAVGPVITTPDDLVPFSEDTDLGMLYHVSVSARVNGVEKRKGNVSDNPYPYSQLLSFASEGAELQPGDLILAGPVAAPDSTRLEPGDEVQVAVEHLGALSLKFAL